MNKLSICIVAYNDYDDVYKAVNSIISYTGKAIEKEIYIVDNSSQKYLENNIETRNAIEKLSDRIVLLCDGKNNGFGKGHNMVLPYIATDYHAIVNPDIIINEDVFTDIINYMNTNTDIGMVIPKITDEKGNRLPVYRREITFIDMLIRFFFTNTFPKRIAYHTMLDMDYSKPFQVPFGQGSFLVIRTTLFKRINGFDERFFLYMEDADLCKKVNQESKLMYFPNVSVMHKWEKGSHKSIKLFYYHFHSMIQYFNKWGWKII